MRPCLALCLAASIALAACGASSKPPPTPPDAAAVQPAGEDASCDGCPGPDAGYQDPGLTRKDGGVPYPAGPYGTTIGKVVDNSKLILSGYPQGDKSAHSGTIQLADFYDPDGTNLNSAGVPYKTLFVDISARWCTVCQAEAGGLAALCDKYAPKGMACYTAIIQDSDYGPATWEDVNYWMETYNIDYPICLDPAGQAGFQWGIFGNADAVPINLFIDLKTMRIVDRVVGADDWNLYFDQYTACDTTICPDAGM